MLPAFIVIIAILAAIVLWGILTQRKLVELDENTSDAMSQIGLQRSNRFDALTALLDVTKGCAQRESEALLEAVKSGRSVITAKSTPDDILRQERVLSEALEMISVMTEQYPELKAKQNYKKAMDAEEVFENMVRSSRWIYNDSVRKLNRKIRMFPASVIAKMLGFRQREYLEEPASGSKCQIMK
ncbi:MAG: LemA family protein [Clostridiales bacterium]|nr:LemA family protein [Clostridiales bacterium]